MIFVVLWVMKTSMNSWNTVDVNAGCILSLSGLSELLFGSELGQLSGLSYSQQGTSHQKLLQFEWGSGL